MLRFGSVVVFAALAGCFSRAALAAAADSPAERRATRPQRQDGRFIEKLRWESPHGELPGTYAEYLLAHPLQPARFGAARQAGPALRGQGLRTVRSSHIALLIDAALYPAIQAAVDQYVADLAVERYSVYLETVSGGTPAEIKSWVQQRYNAGAAGIVFIGDITAAWAEISGDVFPSDLYYMDLDGYWEDADLDGDFETHTAGGGDEGPEIFVARLYAHTLSYDTEANMVNGYLAKAHAYRQGTLMQPWRGLEYVDEDWYSMDVNLNEIYGDDVTRHDYGYFTTAADYLNQMDLGQHFVQVCAHSYSGGHHFGMRPTESAVYAHLYVHSPVTRNAKLLLGCDDGIKAWLNSHLVCTHDTYLGWLPDQYVHNVVLGAGWNRLLCKVSQDGGDYYFSARLTDTSLQTLTDLTYQLNDPQLYGPEGEFIRSWLLNGFHQDISDNFWSYIDTNYLGTGEGAANPTEGQVMGGQTWTVYDANGGYIDLGDYCAGADFGACYAFVRVYSDVAQSCKLWLGYEDGAKVWLNGTRIVYDNRYGDFTLDSRKVSVNLLAGENRLMVKVTEWMGSHGFSARFCQADGGPVTGLTYDPAPQPISYLGTWLTNGPYANPDAGTRLSTDYLGGEAGVRPSEGAAAPQGTWIRATSSGTPVDLGIIYDTDGGWVESQTIQDRDPPVLFYNLFACGPGRFTDPDYLAGAYIFNTTYGLITVASSKSGSMLNFGDFTAPLGAGASLGDAFREWFDAQAPFELWEREWYYGMVLNGDPTLLCKLPSRIPGDLDCDGSVNNADIPAFLLALTDPAAYESAFPNCNATIVGDLDGDGTLNNADIPPFVELLIGGE